MNFLQKIVNKLIKPAPLKSETIEYFKGKDFDYHPELGNGRTFSKQENHYKGGVSSLAIMTVDNGTNNFRINEVKFNREGEIIELVQQKGFYQTATASYNPDKDETTITGGTIELDGVFVQDVNIEEDVVVPGNLIEEKLGQERVKAITSMANSNLTNDNIKALLP